MYIKQLLFLLSFLWMIGESFGQSKVEKKYAIRAQEVEQEVMASHDDIFKTVSVPQEYANASAVILAKKVQLFSDLKSKMSFSLFYGKDVTNTIRYALTIREKIKIQDKSALDEYSEFSFNKVRSQSSFFRNASNAFYGITVIKADGTSKKINIDEEAVNAGDDDDKDKYKLAIPDLQIGDIIDFYSRVEKESSNENPIDPLDIVVGGSYPILHYALDTKFRNGFAAIYSISNSPVQPVETRDDEFVYLKMDLKNIHSKADAIWFYDRMELPVFKINIFPGSTSSKNKKFALGKGQVVNGLPKEWIDKELSYRTYQTAISSASTEFNIAKEYIKNLMKNRRWKDADKDSLIQYIYYYGRFSYLYDYMSDEKLLVGVERNAVYIDSRFYGYLRAMFYAFNIDFDIIYSTPRFAGTIQQAVSVDDFAVVLRAKGNKEYYLVAPNMFTSVNAIPSMAEGQEAYVFKSAETRKSAPATSTIERLPVSKPSDNYSSEVMKVTVDLENDQQITIERTKTLAGHLSYDSQVYLSLFEEYIDQERARFGERTFAQEVVARVGKKRSETLLEEYKQAFGEVRKKRDDFAKTEAENNFEIKPEKVEDFKVLKTGNHHNQREFSFSGKYNLSGMVKRAGNNYILDAGKLIGGQLQVKKEQRERTHHIYQPYARTIEHKIFIQIPEGYTVDGLDKLNKTVENSTGSFVCKATLVDKQVVMEVKKIYKNQFDQLENWPALLAFVDAAFDFSQQKILFKKI